MSANGRVKSYFVRGLAVLLPTILTIWIFVGGYTFVQSNISIYINKGFLWLTMTVKRLDWEDEGLRKIWTDFWIDGWGSITGFVVALVVVLVVGALLANVVGRTLWRMVEKFIMNTPVLRKVFPYVKQVTDFVLAQERQDTQSFKKVVAVEYPRKGIWSVGLVTGSGLKKVTDNIRGEFLTVFIPTSPTPFTGFVIMVPRKQTIDLDMTIEQAFRFTVSGGVITPEHKLAIKAFPNPELPGNE